MSVGQGRVAGQERVSTLRWALALVLNLVSGLIGIFWAVIFVLMGGLFGAGALFGRGGGSGAAVQTAGLGIAFLLTAVVVTLGPLCVGTVLALLRRRATVVVSYVIGVATLLLPWAVLMVASLL